MQQLSSTLALKTVSMDFFVVLIGIEGSCRKHNPASDKVVKHEKVRRGKSLSLRLPDWLN